MSSHDDNQNTLSQSAASQGQACVFPFGSKSKRTDECDHTPLIHQRNKEMPINLMQLN